MHVWNGIARSTHGLSSSTIARAASSSSSSSSSSRAALSKCRRAIPFTTTITTRLQHHRHESTTATTTVSSLPSSSSTAKPHPSSRSLRIAIIGSGPAGFYSARRLLQRLGTDGVQIDMYERLPVPFGLVRFGVAPDHPEVKNCTDTFDEVAASPSFRFLGNVNVGTDVSLAALRQAYDGLLFAYGAAADRRLGIPGEDELEGAWESDGGNSGGNNVNTSGAHFGGRGVYSARAFVGWYNGLPEYADLNPILDSGETAVVLGQGNVALDVARVLLSGVDRLRETDIAEHALAALAGSKIRHVHVVGRRGPMQAAFTIKELRELLTLGADVDFLPIAPGLLPENPKTLPRAKRRIAELLGKYSSSAQSSLAATGHIMPGGSGGSGKNKTWSLDFMKAPRAFLQDPSRTGYLSVAEFTRNQFTAESTDPFAADARVEPVTSDDGQGVIDEIPASLAFRSIGYKSVALPGMEDLALLGNGQGGSDKGGGISFDDRRGILPNIGGRVITSTGSHIPGLYCAGWVKNGPTGVIATTMEDAFATAETVVEDLAAGDIGVVAREKGGSKGGWDQLRKQIEAKGPIVSWSDWQRIDGVEKAAGKGKGKEREKFASVNAMLQAVSQ